MKSLKCGFFVYKVKVLAVLKTNLTRACYDLFLFKRVYLVKCFIVLSLQEILNSDTEQKLQAIEAIQDSINEHSLPVTDEEKQIAQEHYQQYLENPNKVIEWKEAKQQLKAKHGF